MVFFPALSPKKQVLKRGPKIYVLQCTLYVCRNVHLGFFKTCSKIILNSALPTETVQGKGGGGTICTNQNEILMK
jgi:hypothetical protein